MSTRKTLYLANSYGFSEGQRAGPLAELVCALEALGAEVWEPFARNNQVDRAAPGWAYRIGQADLGDVRDADGLFAVVNGCPPDEGVMVELGMAIAWQKPVFLFRDDFRRSTDSEVYPLNSLWWNAGERRERGGARLTRRVREEYRVYFDRNATQSAAKRRGSGGMHRRSNAAWVSPQAVHLMLFTGLPETGWETFWYTSVAEIADPGKALVRWLRQESA